MEQDKPPVNGTTINASHINFGVGEDISILELANLVASIVGIRTPIKPDPEKPDGTPHKLMCNRRISALGWQPKIPLEAGIIETYSNYIRKNSS
jgi:GDP-L-fucose synthase